MAMSKVVRCCDICKKEIGIYSCPRCDRKYCSSQCYRSNEHATCSESFYQEWVETSLRNKTFDDSEREKMVHILKKCHDETTETFDETTSDEPSIIDRFAGLNIDEADEDVLWQNLSKEEKAEFETLIEDREKLEEFINLKQPWWTVTKLNLVSDLDEDEKSDSQDDISVRPHFPLNVKKLSSLTSKKPSTCLQYNIINILYAHAFLYRFFNCELNDFLEDYVNFLFQLCPVLTGKNYSSLEESVQDSIRLILSLDLGVPLDFIKSIVNDVNSLLQGPINAKPSTFVLCALHDIEIQLLCVKSLLENRKDIEKSSRKRLMPAVKKVDYFMSWSLDFESHFSELASDLLVLMLPELFTETDKSKPEEPVLDVVKRKPLIEEIE